MLDETEPIDDCGDDVLLSSDAIQSVASLAQQATEADNRARILKLNDAQYYLLTKDGVELKTQLTKEPEIPLTSVEQIPDYIAQIPGDHFTVTINEKGVVISSREDLEARRDKVLNVVGFTLSSTMKLLFDAASHMSPADMIRMIRTTNLWMEIQNCDVVLRKVDSIVWNSSSRANAAGMGGDKSNYGTFVDQSADVIATDDNSIKETLNDETLVVRVFEDQYLQDVSTPMLCFWEYNHERQQLALVAYGGQLQSAIRETLQIATARLRELCKRVDKDITILRG